MSSFATRNTGSTVFSALGSVARSSVMRQPDYWLLTIILLMVMFGTVMIFSSSFAMGVQEEGGDGYYYLTNHLIYLIVGLAGMLIAMAVDYRVWRRFALPGMLLVIGLLILMVAVPSIAPETWGASRWIQLGPLSFQPSELAKLALVLYLASWLASKGSRIREIGYGLIPFALVMGGLLALIMTQPDLGTSLLLTMIGLSMFLVAGANLFHLGAITLAGAGAFLVLALSASYRRDRIFIFLNPDSDLRNLGWQLTQAKLAIGSGGLFGVGLGASKQKFAWLPAAHNDAIFAVIAEELGLAGAGFVLLLFIALAWRGYRVAMRAPDSFGALAAVGIVTWMIFQAAINIGGITTTIPFTGIPIPFISYGGSSLVVSLTAMGILLNISRQTVDPVTVKVKSRSGRSAREVRRSTSTVGAPAQSAEERTPASTKPRSGRDEFKPEPRRFEPVGSASSPSVRPRGAVRSVDGKSASATGHFGRGARTRTTPRSKR